MVNTGSRKYMKQMAHPRFSCIVNNDDSREVQDSYRTDDFIDTQCIIFEHLSTSLLVSEVILTPFFKLDVESIDE